MKRALFSAAVLVAMLACSCKKTSSSGNSNLPAFYLSSATTFSPGTKVVDSFTYDSSNRLGQFAQFDYDTVAGAPAAKSWAADFVLPGGSSTPPSGYTYSTQGTTQTHVLSYDGQGRIIKDTCTSGTGFVTYFSYPNGNIAMTVLFNGTAMNNQIDTLFLSNGNVTAIHTYGPNSAGTADSLQGTLQFGFSTTPNPLYHSALVTAVGPLLYVLQVDGYGGSLDPISVKAFNSVSGQIDGLPANLTVNYGLITDTEGRLNVMSASLYGSSEITYFVYY